MDNKNYKLKRQYVLSESDGCNYIMSVFGHKCVYLNPIAALMLNYILKLNINNAIDCISKILNIDNAKHQVEKLIIKLNEYLQESVDEREEKGINTDESINILNKSREMIKPLQKEEIPESINFYLTKYCPRHCIYCFAGAKYSKKRVKEHEFLSPERFKEVILESEKLGVKKIEISGGDPFAISNVFDYIDIMVKYSTAQWSVSTKAYISKEDATRLKEINLKEIQVSIDTLNEECADKLMGCKGAFKEVIETIDNLLNVGIEVHTNTVITSLNIYDIPNMFNIFVTEGIKYIRFSYYYISGNRHNDQLFPSNEQFAWLNEKMRDLVKKARENGIYTNFEEHEPNIRENNKKNRVLCGGFNSKMAVRWDGCVVFCDSLNYYDEFVVGNLKEKSIMEIWNSKRAKDMSNPSYFHEKYKGTKCYNCHLFNNCFYKRCYVRTLKTYGKLFDMDPACPLNEDKDYILKT